MSTHIIQLDTERVEKMIARLYEALKDQTLTEEPCRERYFETVNALGVVTATILNASALDGSVDENAGEFFRAVLNAHLVGAPEHKEGEEIWFIPGQKNS